MQGIKTHPLGYKSGEIDEDKGWYFTRLRRAFFYNFVQLDEMTDIDPLRDWIQLIKTLMSICKRDNESREEVEIFGKVSSRRTP